MSSKANKPEPFGYFRAQSWGWEDCAQGDEGAQALYDEDAIRTQAARIAELEAEVERLRKPLTAQGLHDNSKPVNIARWCWDSAQRRIRLLRGHASKSKTRAGRVWRLFWRLKRLTGWTP